MKPFIATVDRYKAAIVALLTAGVLAAGCGGGGGSPSAGTGVNAVRISVSNSPAFPGGITTNAPAKGAGSSSQNIDNVFITVTKVELLPEGGGGLPDPDGETPVEDTGAAEDGLLVLTLPEPKTIDLLHLPGEDVALFLDSFENVPAGNYGKIRLYYTDPKVCYFGSSDVKAARSGANYHLDIRFVGGDLVIPVVTDPAGGVTIFDVKIVVFLGGEGLKVTVNPNHILIRPQIFAESIVLYEVTGIASAIEEGAFDLHTAGGRTFHVVIDPEDEWSFQDPQTGVRVAVNSAQGQAALNTGLTVFVYGVFSSIDTIEADRLVVVMSNGNGRRAPERGPGPS